MSWLTWIMQIVKSKMSAAELISFRNATEPPAYAGGDRSAWEGMHARGMGVMNRDAFLNDQSGSRQQSIIDETKGSCI